MRDLMNMVLKKDDKKTVNRRYLLNKYEPFKKIKPDVSVVDGVEEKLKTEYRLYDEGMFSDASGYLMEVSNVLQDDDIPSALLNRLSVIFRDVSVVAEIEDNKKAGELLIKRFGLGKTGGFELQMEAALVACDKHENILERLNKGKGKNTPSEMKKEIRACNDGFLEKKIDSTGKTIMWALGKYNGSERKRDILNEVIECLLSQYKRRLFKSVEIETHVESACDKLIEDGSIQTNIRNDVLMLIKIK